MINCEFLNDLALNFLLAPNNHTFSLDYFHVESKAVLWSIAERGVNETMTPYIKQAPYYLARGFIVFVIGRQNINDSEDCHATREAGQQRCKRAGTKKREIASARPRDHVGLRYQTRRLNWGLD